MSKIIKFAPSAATFAAVLITIAASSSVHPVLADNLARAGRADQTAEPAARSRPNPHPTVCPSSPRSHLNAATSVVSYDPGTSAAPGFQHPQSALGAPSEINPFGESVDPFNPPYGTNQLVSIGAGGHLTLAFAAPIQNHPRHTFGLDFTIFGNAGFIVTNEFDPISFNWIGTPATDGSLFGSSSGEVIVSVSPDGRCFYVLDPARSPRIDSFPPSDSAGDPSVPVSPELSAEDFAGATMDTIRELYRGSAGGASFDLGTALDARGRRVWLPHVRVIRIDVISGRAEVDAVTAVNRESRGRR